MTRYDKYNQPIPAKVYLATPNNQIICAIDGIEEDSFDLIQKTNDTYELSFNIDRYFSYTFPTSSIIGTGEKLTDDAGRFLKDDESKNIVAPKTIDYNKSRQVESNSYKLAGLLMRIYVDGIGWFIMQPPETYGEGYKEYKSITATSCEIEMQQHDLKSFKINMGTTDSLEMLVDNNVEIIDDVEFAKEQIRFHNPKNPQLSLLDLAIRSSGLKGWSVGYIDTVPETYKTYDDEKYVEKKTLLSDEIGSFDIDSQDLYSFLVQDVAKYFNCIFVFDIKNMTINAYHPDNYGRDTNIHIGFRNLQQSNQITVDEDNIFTRYFVTGDDDLGIQYVNFGHNYIEDISYFLNERYMSKSLIQKYLLWSEDVELRRIDYIKYTKLYNEQLDVITELYDRVPLDDCSTDWSTFYIKDLQEALANYQAQQKGYESYYVDSDGNFDEEALKKSADANDYYQIRDVIIPSIKIEISNRDVPTDDDKEKYIDSYKTDWKLYGLDELQVKLDEYKNIITTCEKGGYNVPYSDESKHTEDVHKDMYKKYLDAKNQLDDSYGGGCKEAYNNRQQEIDDAKSVNEAYDKNRKEIVTQVTKESWTHGEYSFTDSDLKQLSKLYKDGDYTNTNMFLTSSDNQVSAIDEQLKLLKAAQDDLYIMSHPQYKYTTTLDNFLALPEYKNYAENFKIGDFVYLGVRDDYVVKLRAISVESNPLVMDNNLKIEFSNMTQARGKRTDLYYLLDAPSNASKNSSSGNSNNFLNNEGITLTSGLIQKLLSSGAFSNKVSQIINNEFAGIFTDSSISLNELNAKMIKATNIVGENGFFEYLQAKLISAGKIVADSGDFKELNALVATIKNAIIGASTTETGIVINLTAENATISEALIKSLIAQYITVGDLKAGNIITDNIKILSEDGKLQIIGNTFTVYDENNNPVIQLGQDKNGNYGLVISDSNGAILLDSQGLHEGIVSDDFIKTKMIGNGQVTEDKIDKTNIRDWTDSDGNKVFDVSKMYYGDDKFLTSYETIQENVKNLNNSVSNLTNYNVVLSNESQNIPCTSDGITATDMLIEIPFVAYEGIKQVPCSILVTNLPSGITLGENTNSTSNKEGKIVLNVAVGKDLGGILSGNIVFTCTVSGKTTQTIVKKFIWTKSIAGKDGENPIIYSITPSVNVIKKCTIETSYLVDENGYYLVDEVQNLMYGYSLSDALTPSSITFSSYIQTGSSDKIPYPCRFLIMESPNGASYSTKYTSSKDESTVVYTPTTSNLHHIKCIMCKAGGIAEQVDSQTVAIIHDAENYDSAIKSFQDRFSSIALEIDNAEKSISQKATQKDIENTINEYDGTEIKKIREQQSETITEVGKISSKVSDVESIMTTKADGSTVTELTTRVSKAEQDAESFKQTVEKTYGTKEEISTIKQQANEIESRVENNEGEISSVKQQADQLQSTVSNLRGGGTNLIRNSNWLIFENYYFVAVMIDENGNILTDESGNKLIANY